MTHSEMRNVMLCGTPDRNGRVFQPRHLGERAFKEFILYDRHKERDITRPTFMETNYDRIMELLRFTRQPEDEQLLPGDTKELDDFLNSFARKEAS